MQEKRRGEKNPPIGKNAAGWYESVYRVAYGSHEYAKLIPAVQRLLLDAQYHGSQVLVVGEVIPVLGAVEVLLVRFLLDGGELEALCIVTRVYYEN